MEKLRSNPYKKSACPTWPRFQEIVNFQTLIKSDQNMISFWEFNVDMAGNSESNHSYNPSQKLSRQMRKTVLFR